MANVFIEEQTMIGIAEAIREKNGAENKYYPEDMPQAIKNIEDRGIGSKQWWSDMCAGRKSVAYLFSETANEKNIPEFDTSLCENFVCFCYKSGIVILPDFDTSSGTEFSQMLDSCTALITFTAFDTSKAKKLFRLCYGDVSLTNVSGVFDLISALNVSSMFDGCIALISVFFENTENVQNWSNCFNRCFSLEIVNTLDFTSATNVTNAFWGARALKNIRVVEGSIHISLSFAQSSLLNYESRQSIFNGLADLTGQTSQVLTLNKLLEDVITDEEKAYIVSKNWQIAFSS